MKTLRILACALFLGGVCCMTSCGKKEETTGTKLDSALNSAAATADKAKDAAKGAAKDAEKKVDEAKKDAPK